MYEYRGYGTDVFILIDNHKSFEMRHLCSTIGTVREETFQRCQCLIGFRLLHIVCFCI